MAEKLIYGIRVAMYTNGHERLWAHLGRWALKAKLVQLYALAGLAP
jgi:hypothetical protein